METSAFPWLEPETVPTETVPLKSIQVEGKEEKRGWLDTWYEKSRHKFRFLILDNN